MFSWFSKKQPQGLSAEDVRAMIDMAVDRLQERLLTSTPEDHQQNNQIRLLEEKNQRLTDEIRKVKTDYERMADEIQLQISQSQLPIAIEALPTQVQGIAQTLKTFQAQNDQRYRSQEHLSGQIEVTQQGITRVEGQYQDFQHEVRLQFQQFQRELEQQLTAIRNEIPEQSQLSALIEQVSVLQVDIGKWQRFFVQELDTLKQAVTVLQTAPPPMVAPVSQEPLGAFEDYFNAGKILLLSGDSQQALQNLTLALKIKSQNADAWYYLAAAQAQEAMIDKALGSLEHAIDLNPTKRALAATGEDFPALLGNPDYEKLVGITSNRNLEEEDILLPQVDLANLFDMST